jgi:predicted nucleotidyltransferase
MSAHTNILRIKTVHDALGSLKDEVVFVGGATVSLYAERAEEIRPTDDVDILLEIWTYKDYAAVEEQLLKLGFVNDQFSRVICRFTIQEITVDIMPTGENVLGFSNKWYPEEGYKNALKYRIDEARVIKILAAPYFIATKLEAFNNRGKNDGRTSTDFEDIVFVLENRFSIWEELNVAPDDVKNYLKDVLRQLLKTPHFEEWINSHAGFGSPPATTYIINKLAEFIG